MTEEEYREWRGTGAGDLDDYGPMAINPEFWDKDYSDWKLPDQS